MVHHHPPWFLGGLNSTKGRKTSRVDARTWWLWDKKNCQEIPRRLWSFSLVDFLWIFNELNGEWSEGLGVGNPCLSAICKVFSQINKFRDPPNGWIARNLQWRSKKYRLSEWPTSSCETLRSLRSSLAPHFWGGIWWNMDTTWYNRIVPNSSPLLPSGECPAAALGSGWHNSFSALQRSVWAPRWRLTRADQIFPEDA